MLFRFLMRRDFTENWEAANPVLKRGEFGVELCDEGYRLKIGDGVSEWKDLPYAAVTVRDFESHLADPSAHGIDSMAGEIGGIKTGVEALFDSLDADLGSVKNRVGGLERGIGETNERLESLTGTVNRNRTETDAAIAGLNSGANGLRTRVGDLENAALVNANDILRTADRLTRHEHGTAFALDGVRDRVTRLEGGESGNRADINDLMNAVDELNNSVNLEGWRELAGRVDGVETGVNDLRPRADALEAGDARNRNDIIRLFEGLAETDGRVGTVENGQAALGDSVADMRAYLIGRVDGIDSYIAYLHKDVTNIKWEISVIWNSMAEVLGVGDDVIRVRLRLDGHDADIAALNRDLRAESETRQNQIDGLRTVFDGHVLETEIALALAHAAIADEAAARNRQITEAVTAEAQAREQQIHEVNGAMTNGFAELNGQIQATNSVLDGVRTTSLHGAYLTRELGGTTDVPIILFRSFSNFQAGKTLVFDDNGTQGVFTGNVDGATIRVMTKSISHMSDLKPTLLGSVPTRADLPEISEEAAGLFGRMPRIDDHAFVLNDETHDGLRVIWYVIDIVEIPYEGDAYGMIPFPPPPPTITIVWGNPIPVNRDDFQAQTGAVDSGRVLTGGATPGTFGESISIDIEAAEGSNNLITSDAVYQAMERIREENSFNTDESNTGQNWIDGNPIYRRVLTGNTGTASPTVFGFIENLGSFVNIRGHIRNPLFIDNINTVDINFETGELRGHWPQHGVINTPVWNWWNVGSPTVNFAASGSHNNINGLNVGRLGGAAGGITWGPAGFAMGGNRFTVGAVSPSGTTETTPSMRIAGVLDFTMPTLLEIDFGSASGAGAFQVSINNNTISMANSVHGNASRVVNQTMSGSGTFQHLIDTREWTVGRQFLDSATITLRGEGTLTMQIFAIRLLRRTSWENSEFNIIFEYTRNH